MFLQIDTPCDTFREEKKASLSSKETKQSISFNCLYNVIQNEELKIKIGVNFKLTKL